MICSFVNILNRFIISSQAAFKKIKGLFGWAFAVALSAYKP
jgi:hypothetical protein